MFDINQQAVNELVQKSATTTQTPAGATKGAESIITMLPNDGVVRQVLLDKDGVGKGLSPNTLIIDMSTIHPLQTDELVHKMEEKGISMMDAPAGRTPINTIDGTLLILAGGTPEQVRRTHPVLMCMGNELVGADSPGMGIRVKFINNYMNIALSALSAGAAILYKSLGLSLDMAVEVMSGATTGKGYFVTTWPDKVLKGDLSPTFMVDLALKDLRIAVDVASQTDAPLNTGIVAETCCTRASENGRDRQDWGAPLSQVRQQTGRPDSL